MGNNTTTAPVSAVLNDTEVDTLTASIAHLTGPDTDAVIEALLPALEGIIADRCAADRAVVMAQVNAFRARVQRSMVRVQRDTEKHADSLLTAL